VNQEQYIEHEVKLRVNDEKFMLLRENMNRLNAKLNFMQATIIMGIILQIVLHYFRMI
jgi:hypothetical protein